MPRALIACAGRFGSLREDERGTSTSEFVVLLVCIAIACIAAVRYFGEVILDIIGVAS